MHTPHYKRINQCLILGEDLVSNNHAPIKNKIREKKLMLIEVERRRRWGFTFLYGRKGMTQKKLFVVETDPYLKGKWMQQQHSLYSFLGKIFFREEHIQQFFKIKEPFEETEEKGNKWGETTAKWWWYAWLVFCFGSCEEALRKMNEKRMMISRILLWVVINHNRNRGCDAACGSFSHWNYY